jgi:FixJ family two-component response regulator
MTAGDSTVFIIDDDESVRASIGGLLKSVGLRSQSFVTPQEFLDSNCSGAPGCLVLDVGLPDLSGLNLQHKLNEAGVQIPIIFITGGDISLPVEAMKSGTVEFLTKPFRDQELLDAITRALDRDRAMRQRK